MTAGGTDKIMDSEIIFFMGAKNPHNRILPCSGCL